MKNLWLPSIITIVIGLAALYLAYRRGRHAQATARVAELRVYSKPDSPWEYRDAVRWLKRAKVGYFGQHEIAMKAIEPFVWVTPEWDDEHQSAMVVVNLYVENLGNTLAKSVKFIIPAELPGIHIEIDGGGVPAFGIPGFEKLNLIYKDLGNLVPGIPCQLTVRTTFDSPKRLFELFYRSQWTRLLGVPVLPPATRFYEDPSFPVLYWLVSEDTRRHEMIMLITCCCTSHLNQHLTVGRLRSQAQEALAPNFNADEFALLVRERRHRSIRRLKSDVRRYIRRARRATDAAVRRDK